MTEYTTKKSRFSVEGFFRHLAFELFRPTSNLCESVITSLSDFYRIQGRDIRIDNDANPLTNANVTFDIRSFHGVARVFIDRARLILFDPHEFTTNDISALSLAFFDGVQNEIGSHSYGDFLIQSFFHAELEGISPAQYTATHLSSTAKSIDSIIGSSVTYYLEKEGARSHSSVSLDMSDEFSECVFVHVVLRYDSNEILSSDIPSLATHHYNQLLSLIGMESTQ